MSTPASVIPGEGATPNEGVDPNLDLNPEGSQPAGDEGTPSDNSPEPEDGEEGLTPDPGTEGAEGTDSQDGRVVPQWIRGLKEANPKAYQQAKDAFFRSREYQSVYPTVQAAREDKQLVESLGGKQGVERMQEDVTFFHQAAGQFLKGDPAFTADFFEEDPIAAALHVQPMLDNYAKHDPQGYSSTLARTWKKEFDAVGLSEKGLVPLYETIQGMADSPAKKAALSIVKSIYDWQQSIEQVASKVEDPRVKSLLAERNKRQETAEQSAQEEFIKSYKTESMNEVVSEAEKVFDSFFRGRKLDKEDRTDLLRESLTIANRAVLTDKRFLEQRDKHLNRGDSHAARQLTKARFAAVLPEAVKRVAKRYSMTAGPAKQLPNQQRQPNGQQLPKGLVGYTAVNTRPQQEEVDYSRTTRDDIVAGKAILKDGRKVTWAHLRQKAS